MYGSKKQEILKLLHQGVPYNKISRIVGCSKGTIAYHAKKHNLVTYKDSREGNYKRVYDWEEVQKFYDAGNSVRDCISFFGFSSATWGKAARRGEIKTRKQKPLPLQQVMVKDSTYSRGTLKKRLLGTGLIRNECSLCLQGPSWQDKSLTFILDHINGINNDNRLENLRLLCPNCNSQTSTFSGRNCAWNYKENNTCKDCETEIGRKSIRCRSCSNKVNSERNSNLGLWCIGA